ncbi:MAG: group I intron-associated PD-(D/E)XK endonuclease [Actinomycetota bacterium]|nr:group I intron-associated PD-(D/E)XK endonuclease [Actinomycetota bacterium]
MNRQQQGDRGEMSAMCWYGETGHLVYVPVGHSADVDFIADDGRRLIKVQVKTTSQFRLGRWEVAICTRGGNQSWNGVVKHFSADRCDDLFVVAVDGRRWRIPSAAVRATSGLRLGGPKYADFEVDAGRPLTTSPQAQSLS